MTETREGKLLALAEKPRSIYSECPLCKGNIGKIICHTHDEEFETGHDENCPNRNTEIQIGDDCVTERVD